MPNFKRSLSELALHGRAKRTCPPLVEAGERWGLDGLRVRPATPIPGSPERCLARLVVESAGRSYLLERIAPDKAGRREALAWLQIDLAARRLPFVFPPAPILVQGEKFQFIADIAEQGLWQLSPFVEGVDLPRPNYVFDEARGERLGAFLVELERVGGGLSVEGRQSVDQDRAPFSNRQDRDCRDGGAARGASEDLFSLSTYVNALLANLTRRRPALRQRMKPVLDFLADHVAAIDELPRRLRHGDFHPLNVIWGEEGPRAVIDWEFAGPRPALWDAAVCVGCVGVEAPPGLLRGLVPAMLGVLTRSGMFDGPDRTLFLELVLAQRFGWLAEWLRREDGDMIDLEMDYMTLLMDNAGTLRRAWGA